MIAAGVSRVRLAPRPAIHYLPSAQFIRPLPSAQFIRPLPSAQFIRPLPSAQFRSALASSAPEPIQPNRHAAPLLHCAVGA